jgi:Winged helix domain, variant/ATPase family associated with various cellular activities (AAA)
MTVVLAADFLTSVTQRLDNILGAAVQRLLASYGPDAASDPFRGLYISQSDAARLFEPWPAASVYADEPADPSLTDLIGQSDTFGTISSTYGLSNFDLDVILLALAPELDLRYERVFAFIQDDVSRRRPSVDLALKLLCATPESRMHNRRRFAPSAPLLRHDLIHLISDANYIESTLLARMLKLDERVVCRLLGENRLDPALASCCTLFLPHTADEVAVSRRGEALLVLIRNSQSTGEPIRLYFSGAQAESKRREARALAAAIGASLLALDLGHALTQMIDFAQLTRRLLDELRSRQAILYVEPFDLLLEPDRAGERHRLLEALAEYNGVTILSGVQSKLPRGRGTHGQLQVDWPIPSHEQRVRSWRDSLDAAGEAVDEDLVDTLAGRFLLMPDQISDAVAGARIRADWRMATATPNDGDSPRRPLDLPNLFEAARAQSEATLEGLARKIEPVHSWDQIVLPADTLAQLREMCEQVVYRHRVLDEWGFGSRLSVGKAVTALFVGPPGTGKTMAADIIAHELGLDLYKIDLSGVVSKYIGETEKNLRRIFSAAENANAILFFDEADALFGKRSEVRDSHDRYANIEVAYLLQQMDQYQGVAILATNLRQNMDEAFVRRLGFAIDFPFPDEEQRAQIWRLLFPPEASRVSDIDFSALGNQLRITGGNIKNIVLSAAFLAASANESVGTEHLLHATRREYRKMGKVLSADLRLARADAEGGKGLDR